MQAGQALMFMFVKIVGSVTQKMYMQSSCQDLCFSIMSWLLCVCATQTLASLSLDFLVKKTVWVKLLSLSAESRRLSLLKYCKLVQESESL